LFFIPSFKSFQLVFFFFRLRLFFLILIFCHVFLAKASQEAIVVADEAVVYSDLQMSSPVGYISKGKKIVIGEIPRNKSQVYPIVVSGRIAYIRVMDVSTEKEAMDSQKLVAERFQELANKLPETRLGVSYFNFYSTVGLDANNGDLLDGQELQWQGVGLKASALVKKKYDFNILTHYLGAGVGDESFRVVEVGFGGTFRLIQNKFFLLRFEGDVLGVPHASYSVGSDFRVNSYGYSTGGGMNMALNLTENFGIEAFGKFYYTKIFPFRTPGTYKDISPSFFGHRLGLGLQYMF
jgi:hypothetical protein